MSAVVAPPVAAPAVPRRPDRPSRLLLNGHALVASSAITSVLGIAYWVIAARAYPPEVVGLNAAAIAAMTFVAGISHLNLTSALVRFLPRSGRQAAPFTAAAYGGSLVVAAAASTVFFAGLHWWFPRLEWLTSHPLLMVVFTLSTMTWCVFVLQDAALTGLGRAGVVPVSNTVFSTLKILLLVVFAATMPTFGVFTSWALAALVAIVPTNAVMFRRFMPRQVEEAGEPIQAGPVLRYVAGDCGGYACWLAATTLMPVVVTRQLGEEANAYFSLAWVIAYALYLVSANLGLSLIVEGARDRANLRSYGHRVLRHTLGLVGAAVAVVLVGAPQMLGVFGPDYAESGSTALRILALSAIPNCIMSVYVSAARVQRRVKESSVVLGALMALVFVLAFALMPRYGIVGVALAWLIAQSVVAAALAGRLSGILEPAPDAAPDQERGRGRWLATVGAVAGRATGAMGRADQRRSAAGVANEWLGSRTGTPTLVATVGDVTVATLAPSGHHPAAVVKVARSPAGAASLSAHMRVLAELRADRRVDGWTDLLPEVLMTGERASGPWMVERRLPGVDLTRALRAPGGHRLLEPAAAAISELHARTASPVELDAGAVEGLVGGPLATLALHAGSLGSGSGRLDRLRTELVAALEGRSLPLGFVHGDFTTGNVLVDPAGGCVTGIVDWDRGRPADLPVLDLTHLALSSAVVRTRRELGAVVVEALDRGLPGPEAALLERMALPPGTGLRPWLLLAWVRHVDNNLGKSLRYASHGHWLRANVERVLRAL